MNDMHDSLDDEKLRRLLDAVDKLPRDAEPPASAWDAIRGRIDAQRVVAIAPGAETTPVRRSTRWWQLAAAAGIVIAAAVAVKSGRQPIETAVVTADSAPIAPRTAIPLPIDSPNPRPTVRALTAVPASLSKASPALAAALDQYQQASRELEASISARTAAMPPATREVVRRSLATIDAAIADLRTALGADPHNSALGQYLSTAYEQKLDFLKRVRGIPVAGM